MRVLNIVLCLFMILFIGVQYNDPDGFLWMAVYAVPAVWTAVAVFKNRWLRARPAHVLMLLSIFSAVAGMIYYWPTTPGWWRQDVWWEVETAREGMGMMIVAIVLLIVWAGRPRNVLSEATGD